MKKSLLALAALSAFAGVASAQSSVTLFGIVDAAYAHLSAGGRSVSGMTNSGLNSSRLGFRGVEDMGGGLRASFHVEMQLGNDDGTAGGGNGLNANAPANANVAASPGALFHRRSTVSLIGGFGEVRLGRDLNPSFLNITSYDPFGTNGVGTTLASGMISAAGAAAGAAAATAGVNQVRTNNSITYFLPGGLGGFRGSAMIGFGERTSNLANKGEADYFGTRLGFGSGPVSVDFAYAKSNGASGASNIKYTSLSGSFDLGVVRPMIIWATEKAGTGAKVRGVQLGLVAPIGQNEIRAAYSRYDVTGTGVSANDYNKMAIGYGYNLSRRTQLYGTYARVSNDGTQNRSVSNNGLSAGAASPGGSSNGYELGIRHSF